METAQSHGEASASPFRRPSPDDAVAMAKARFLRGERVEMQSLASDLDIGRTTLYRWVGERDQLLDKVLGELVADWFAEVAPGAKGRGRALLLDVMRRFLEFAAGFEPLSELAAREPALTMRLLLDRDGMVAERSRALIRTLLDEQEPDLEVPDRMINAIEMSAASLVWANIAIGREPDIDGAIELCSTLLEACDTR